MPETQASGPLHLFTIDGASPVPPFRQVYETVVSGIADGRLVPGQKLPTVRALAAELGLAVNTVASAYKSLEADQVVEGRGRAGTFVRLGDNPIDAESRRIALDAVESFVRIGITEPQAIRLLEDAYRAR